MGIATFDCLASFAQGPYAGNTAIGTMVLGLFQDTQGAPLDQNLSLANLTLCNFDGYAGVVPSIASTTVQGSGQNVSFANVTFSANGPANLPQSANGWYILANNGISDFLFEFGTFRSGNFTFRSPGDTKIISLSNLLVIGGNPAPPIGWVATGTGVITNDTAVTKNVSGPGWDGQCYSTLSFTNTAIVSFKFDSPAIGSMLAGLSFDPASDTGQNSLQYAAYNVNGALYALILGGAIDLTTAISGSDIISVEWDAANILIKVNGTVKGTFAAPLSLPLSIDVWFYTSGLGINSVSFSGT